MCTISVELKTGWHLKTGAKDITDTSELKTFSMQQKELRESRENFLKNTEKAFSYLFKKKRDTFLILDVV